MSPALARRALSDHFGDGLHPTAAATLELLCSEVVTNCVQHAKAGAGVPIEMRAWRLSDAIHVEVSTAAGPFMHPRVAPRPYDDRGRGLHIVEALSQTWGVVDNGRNTVWFKVDAPIAEA